MINLKDYLKVDTEKHKYLLPLSFFEYLKYLFIKIFLENLPFKNQIYIDSKIGSIYWEIIYEYLYNKFQVKISSGWLYFENIPIIYNANIWHEDKHLKSKGYGNSSEDEEDAISKAIGEFLERNSAMSVSLPENKNIKEMNLKDVQNTSKIISDFHDFNSLQKEKYFFLNFDNNKKVQVLPVEDLINKKQIYYPVQSIFFNPKYHETDGVLIAQTTTSGVGAGFTLEMASISAIYEAIERDSFFCYWLTKNIPNKIIINQGEIKEYDKLKNILENSIYEIFVLDTTTDIGIPSICCVVKNITTNGICVSGGADLNYKKAIKKAVLEMYSCLVIFGNSKILEIDEKNYQPFLDMKLGREERLTVWQHGKNYKDFQFFISGPNVLLDNLNAQSVNIENKAEEFGFVVNKIKNTGGDCAHIYRYVFQNENLQYLGYFVVRIIIPKLYPLYLTEAFAKADSARLKDFNKFKKGVGNFDLNNYPHPFP